MCHEQAIHRAAIIYYRIFVSRLRSLVKDERFHAMAMQSLAPVSRLVEREIFDGIRREIAEKDYGVTYDEWYNQGVVLVIQIGRSGYPSDRLDYPSGSVLIIRSSLVYLSI